MAGRNYVQALERGIAVVQAVAHSEDGAGLQAIASQLGLKAPTVHNLIRTLAAHGWLERVGTPVRYRLGRAVAELLRENGERLLLRRAAKALLGLQALHPQAVLTLAERVGAEVVIALRSAPERPGVVERPQGHLLGAYSSAATLLFQAYWNGEERAAYRSAHPFLEQGAPFWKNPSGLERFLEDVRAQGHAVLDLEGEMQFRAAAPVFGRGSELRATLGLALPAAARSRRAAVRDLVEAAGGLSAAASAAP